MDITRENPFIFSSRYRIARHLIFWLVSAVIFTYLFKNQGQNIGRHFLLSILWVPIQIIYAYPIVYGFIPRFLLKGKFGQFALIMLIWGVAGLFWNAFCRTNIYFPVAERMNFAMGNKNPWAAASFLTMNVMAGFASMVVLFKYWIKKQKDFLTVEKEKVKAELQLLKAQVHPHFLFNTLNNIYSYSLTNSSQTSPMILKLSSLLSYMLYDCKTNEVLLEKEIEVMKNYIDLEKERYANRLEISINIIGDIKDKYIAPLLLLPFLENAFKHGTSEQLEKPWLSMDVSVKRNMLRCKIVNSKNEMRIYNKHGIGFENVKKRLAYLYPGKHELKLSDEDNFFVVSLLLELKPVSVTQQEVEPDSLEIALNMPS